MADLHQIIRDAYLDKMARRQDSHVAFQQCVGLMKRHRPDLADEIVRRRVAWMIAEEQALTAPR
jgi:hypothetical protein